MRLLILALTIAIISFLAPTNLLASDDDNDDEEENKDDSGLITATDANFASQTDNFTAGQTIWIKVDANSEGSQKRQLNLRDNIYNLLTSYSLELIGNNQFKTSFSAPNSTGYYSLEARIESPGSVSTSVKTIKVGNPQNSNINVKVESKSEGQTLGKSTSPTPQSSPSQLTTPTPSPTIEPSPTTSPNPIISQKNIFDTIQDFFASIFKIFDFIDL